MRSLSARVLAAGSIVLLAHPIRAAAQQVDSLVCDTVRLPGLVRRVRAEGALARPFTDSSAGVLRPRHEVLAPAGTLRGGSGTRLGRGADGRLRRVRRDAVLKDRVRIRVVKDSSVGQIGCVPAAVLPRQAAGEVAPVTPVPLPPVVSADVPGLANVIQPVGRGGWLSAPPIFGGLLLGGTAIALGRKRDGGGAGGGGGGGGTDTTIVQPPVTPPPVTPPPVTPPPVTPPPVTPPPVTPPPVTPPATTVPEPATVALVGLGVAGLAGARRRRRGA